MKDYDARTLLQNVFPIKLKASLMLALSCAIAVTSAGLASAQLTEGTSQPPKENDPKPRFPQLPGERPDPREIQPTTEADPTTEPAFNPNDFVARIVSVDQKTRNMTVVDKDQEENYTVGVHPKAKITLNRKPAQFSQLKANDFVRLTMDDENPKVATIVAAARVVKDTPPSEITTQNIRPRPRTEQRPTVDRQGGLGVVITDTPNAGVMVVDVNRGTPAWESGIQSGDYLVRMDGKVIVTPDEFLTYIQAREPKEAVKLTIWRKGETRTGAVKLTTHEVAQDREVIDRGGAADRGVIFGELDGTVILQGTPGQTGAVGQEPNQSTILERQSITPPAVIDRGAAGATQQNGTAGTLPQEGAVGATPRNGSAGTLPQEGAVGATPRNGAAGTLPQDYETLATRYRELQRRFDLLELKLRELEKSQ